MKLTTVSNYINHHRIPLSNRLYQALGEDYHFIQTEPMAAERVNMGWGKDTKAIPYLKCFYEEPESCAKLIMDSDIVIFSGLEEESYIQERLKAGKIVIRGSERLYREGQWKAISPRGLRKKYIDHTRYRNAPVYLLCHGAYVASDFNIVKAYPGKMFQWGYFTETKQYDLEELFRKKSMNHQNTVQNNTQNHGEGRDQVNLLWAGRFLKLKHPEYAIEAAKRLKEQNISFHLDMIGDGEMAETCRELVKTYQLEQQVSFLGFHAPDEVRTYMEQADIFLFTSNYLEGWGAVLNESMNSGCAVVTDASIGAVPFLIKHGRNGMVYKDGNLDEFCSYVLQLAQDDTLRRTIGEAAYHTITDLWNPDHAAKCLLEFCTGLLERGMNLQPEGPLSPAPIISPRNGYQFTRNNF